MREMKGQLTAHLFPTRPRAHAPRVLAAALLGTSLVAATFVAATPTQAADVVGDGNTVTLSDPVGEENDVFVNWGNSSTPSVTIRDYAGFGIVRGTCTPNRNWSDDVNCSGRPEVTLHLGPGNDRASSGNLMAVGTTTVMHGGGGDDTLVSGAGADRLHGGPGNDTLIPDGDDPRSGDVLTGGPGVDLLDLRPVVASQLRASLDGVANDGRPGDRDNYGADLENVNGSMIARNTIVGNNRRNVLVGGDLSDVLVGGGGKDELDAGAGSDSVNALDGRGGDRVSCGSGADVVHADPGDVMASDCEKRFLAARVSALRHTARGSRVQAKVSCPKSATGPCRGTLRLVKGKKTLVDRSYSVKRGKAKRVSLKTTAPGRKALRGKKKLKVQMRVSVRGVAPAAGVRVTLRRR